MSIRKMIKRLLLSSLLFCSQVALSTPSDVDTCFTPGKNCEMRIIDAIHLAHDTIDIQAYQLTSPVIRNSLITALNRGIKIRVILDKSQNRGKYPAAIFFKNMCIPVWIDNKVAIAHNKVIIIDNKEVITGSYNYSKAAQYRNAENVVFIISKEIAKKYEENFNYRLKNSIAIY